MQAFGLTHRVEGFKALASVASELNAIVGPQALPGKIWLDDNFTEATLENAIETRSPVIHLASHFVFKPGSEESFLVLGDGTRLYMSTIKNYSFRKLNLLTLSACETALGGGRNENGREVEGFGAQALRRGADAVLATLWKVNDEGTALVMQRFYKLLESEPGMTKAEALRQAQVELIKRRTSASSGQDGGTATAQNRAATPEIPPAPRRSERMAHPYYWAPFVLMGNWL